MGVLNIFLLGNALYMLFYECLMCSIEYILYMLFYECLITLICNNIFDHNITLYVTSYLMMSDFLFKLR